MTRSINNYLIVECYNRGSGLNTKVQNGFASIEQSSALKPLKLLVDAVLNDNATIKAGSLIFFEERWLYTDIALKLKKTLDGVDVMVIPYSQAIAVKEST